MLYPTPKIDQSFTGTRGRITENVYNFHCYGYYGGTPVPYGVGELSGNEPVSDGEIQYQVKQPTANNLAGAKLAFFNSGVPSSTTTSERFFVSISPLEPIWVAYDSALGTPTVGGTVGTVTGSYKVKAGNTGLYVLKVDTSEGLCLVRPFSEGHAEYTGSHTFSLNNTAGGGGPYYSSTQALANEINVTYDEIFVWESSRSSGSEYILLFSKSSGYASIYAALYLDLINSGGTTVATALIATLTGSVNDGGTIYADYNTSFGSGSTGRFWSYTFNPLIDGTATSARTRLVTGANYAAGELVTTTAKLGLFTDGYNPGSSRIYPAITF